MVLSFTTKTGDATTTSADALIMPIALGEAVADALDARLNHQLVPTLAAAGFTGKTGDIATVATLGLLPTRWLIWQGWENAGNAPVKPSVVAMVRR